MAAKSVEWFALISSAATHTLVLLEGLRSQNCPCHQGDGVVWCGVLSWCWVRQPMGNWAVGTTDAKQKIVLRKPMTIGMRDVADAMLSGLLLQFVVSNSVLSTSSSGGHFSELGQCMQWSTQFAHLKKSESALRFYIRVQFMKSLCCSKYKWMHTLRFDMAPRPIKYISFESWDHVKEVG